MKRYHSSGFTLVELIGAIVIISIALLSILTMLRVSVNFTNKSRQETIAINLAREGMEAVYHRRNTNWLKRSGERDKYRLCYNNGCNGRFQPGYLYKKSESGFTEHIGVITTGDDNGPIIYDFLTQVSPNGFVQTIARQSDGKILIGGSFTFIGSEPRNRIARLNPDGSLDTSFNPGANNTVLAINIQSDGKIVIGGRFTKVGGFARNRIARLNPDGSLDTSFNPGANNAVWAINIQSDGGIVIGGQFTNVGGFARNRIARLTTTGGVDANFDPNVDNTIHDIDIQSDGKIVIGGRFTTVGGDPSVRVSRLNPDGSLDADFNTSNGPISHVFQTVIQDDGKILVGGVFSQIQGVGQRFIARLNPDSSLDTSFNPQVSERVHAIALQSDGKILIGGRFTKVGGIGRNYIARLTTTGGVDANFDPSANDNVLALNTQSNGKILIGGQFTSMNNDTNQSYFAILADSSNTNQLPRIESLLGLDNKDVFKLTGSNFLIGAVPDSADFYRAVIGIGLYQKDTNLGGGSPIYSCTDGDQTYDGVDLNGDPLSNEPCAHERPKEFRFCSRVEYEDSKNNGAVELCGGLTNYQE